MTRFWLRDTTNNHLTGRITEVDPPPAVRGYDWVNEDAIRMRRATGPIEPGADFTGTSYTSPPGKTGAALVAARRNELVGMIRNWMDVRVLARYVADDPTRAKGFMRMLESRFRASLEDANLSSNPRYTIIRNDLLNDPARFLWKFQVSNWYDPVGNLGYYGPQIDGTPGTIWQYHSIDSLTANDTANNVQGSLQATVTMHQSDVDWKAEVAKLTS